MFSASEEIRIKRLLQEMDSLTFEMQVWRVESNRRLTELERKLVGSQQELHQELEEWFPSNYPTKVDT